MQTLMLVALGINALFGLWQLLIPDWFRRAHMWALTFGKPESRPLNASERKASRIIGLLYFLIFITALWRMAKNM